MGVNEIDFRGLSAAQGLNSGLRLGATLGGMYRDNRLQDQELEREEQQRIVDDAARDAAWLKSLPSIAEQRRGLALRIDRGEAGGKDMSDSRQMLALPDDQFTQELDYVYNKALPASSLVKDQLGSRKFIGTPQRVKQEGKSYLVGVVDNGDGSFSEERVEIPGDFIGTDGLTADESIEQARALANAKKGVDLEMDPQIKKATKQAEIDAQTEADEKATAKKNSKAFELYQVAFDPIKTALNMATTGPFLGKMASLSEDNQMFRASIKQAIPLLKTFFREKGEGNFTEGDQLVLEGLLPEEGEHKSVTLHKLETLDRIVRTKLGQPLEAAEKRDAPSAAIQYLRQNDSPKLREQFKAKYGYLPEGM